MSTLTERPPSTIPPKISPKTFMGVIWAGVATSFCFLSIRIFIRARKFRRLYWDDLLVVFAWILSLGTAIDWQIVSDYMYQFMLVTSGRLWPPPVDLVRDTERYYKGSMIVLAFFYGSLWAIKGAFLIFFKSLIRDIRSLTIHWWVVTAFTGLSFAACFADTQYWCLVAPLEEIIKRCSTPHDIYWGLFTLKFNCSLDVITDFMIMSIPCVILWHVKIPLQKKIALFGLFSLVMITALFAVLRVALITKFSKQPEPTWAYMWTSLEQNMAIIVACLGTFRTLFVQDKPLVGPTYSFREASRNIFRRKRALHPLEETVSLDECELASRTKSQISGTSAKKSVNESFTRKHSESSDAPIVVEEETK